MSSSYLTLENISKSFGNGAKTSRVLENVNLGVDKGEFIAIIGHSGCGKSTVLNIVDLLLPATEGIVLLYGR